MQQAEQSLYAPSRLVPWRNKPRLPLLLGHGHHQDVTGLAGDRIGVNKRHHSAIRAAAGAIPDDRESTRPMAQNAKSPEGLCLGALSYDLRLLGLCPRYAARSEFCSAC